jgi:hypothetical protein
MLHTTIVREWLRFEFRIGHRFGLKLRFRLEFWKRLRWLDHQSLRITDAGNSNIAYPKCIGRCFRDDYSYG